MFSLPRDGRGSRVRAQIVADIDCHESLALVAG